MSLDFSHLDAIQLRLSNERVRLANAKTDAEKRQRAVWVAAAEKELFDERNFLGISAVSVEMSDENLLAELRASYSISSDLNWPVITQELVFHLGSLDPALKGSVHRESLEGNGLSVSVHPLAWQKIARLGGAPAWALTAEGGKFLDVLGLSTAHVEYVMDWASKAGYVQSHGNIVRVEWIDDELGQSPVYMDFDGSTAEGEAAAKAEFEEKEGCESTLERLSGWSSSEAMNARAGFSVGLSLVKDIALTFFVEDVLFDQEGFHGAWWNEYLDASAYSAPRGVIHLRALPLWDRALALEETLPSALHEDDESESSDFERE